MAIREAITPTGSGCFTLEPEQNDEPPVAVKNNKSTSTAQTIGVVFSDDYITQTELLLTGGAPCPTKCPTGTKPFSDYVVQTELLLTEES